jgi:pimeloyl-ACP methyl ester carboxylesterase
METTSADGTTIAYDVSGSGPPVVIVHGAYVSRAIDSFPVELAGVLASTFTVAHYERRGRGESGDTAPYAVEREIEDLRAVIEAVGDGPAYVLGLSSGAVLALEAAAAGAPIAKLVMYEPPFVVDDSRDPIPDDYVATLDRLIAAGRPGDAIAHAMTTAVGLPAEMVTGMRGAPFFPLMEAIGHTTAYDARIMNGQMAGKPLQLARWEHVPTPILVLVGEQSDRFFQTGTRAFAEGMPTATHRSFVTGADESHAVTPEALAHELEEFFA